MNAPTAKPIRFELQLSETYDFTARTQENLKTWAVILLAAQRLLFSWEPKEKKRWKEIADVAQKVAVISMDFGSAAMMLLTAPDEALHATVEQWGSDVRLASALLSAPEPYELINRLEAKLKSSVSLAEVNRMPIVNGSQKEH